MSVVGIGSKASVQQQCREVAWHSSRRSAGARSLPPAFACEILPQQVGSTKGSWFPDPWDQPASSRAFFGGPPRHRTSTLQHVHICVSHVCTPEGLGNEADARAPARLRARNTPLCSCLCSCAKCLAVSCSSHGECMCRFVVKYVSELACLRDAYSNWGPQRLCRCLLLGGLAEANVFADSIDRRRQLQPAVEFGAVGLVALRQNPLWL